MSPVATTTETRFCPLKDAMSFSLTQLPNQPPWKCYQSSLLLYALRFTCSLSSTCGRLTSPSSTMLGVVTVVEQIQQSWLYIAMCRKTMGAGSANVCNISHSTLYNIRWWNRMSFSTLLPHNVSCFTRTDCSDHHIRAKMASK